MKKTLVALAVLAAGSAQAGIELYNNDGVTVEMKGDIEVVYVKGTDDGSEFTQEIQDADFGFDVRYQVTDDLQFGGYWEFDGASGDVTDGKDSLARVGDAYVAFYSDSLGSIKFGRTCGALDDAGVGSDYQFGVNGFFENNTDFCGDEMVRYDIDKGMFYGTLALAQDQKGTDRLGSDGSYFDVKAGLRVADFDFTAYFAAADLSAQAATTEGKIIEDGDVVVGAGNVGEWGIVSVAGKPQVDESIWALEARFSGIENTNFELGYYAVSVDAEGAAEADYNTLALAADYTIESVTLAAGYSMSEHEDSASDVDNWFVNAGYGFAPNTTAYVEVGGNDKDNSETGVAIGVKASF
ncbi:porin [Vibrio sp. NTOU-M3]|uniref:porin n=1 Tax=Vibrio sp. NTOU-M3 TaxID=3234954 RepID=UPI00349FC802